MERIEIEDNRVGDSIIIDFVDQLIDGGKIVYFNASKNNITDTGAKSIANLIKYCSKLRLLFLHYNKIMGIGGLEIAKAIEGSNSIQVFDISFNSIAGSGFKILKPELKPEDEEKKKNKKPSKKKAIQIGGSNEKAKF